MGKRKCGSETEKQVGEESTCKECLLDTCLKCGSKEVFLKNEDSDYSLCKACWKEKIKECTGRMKDRVKQMENDERFLSCDYSINTDAIGYALEIIQQELEKIESSVPGL